MTELNSRDPVHHPRNSGEKPTASITDTPALPANRYDLQVLQSLRRIMRAVDIYSRKLKNQCNLTAPQLVCLSALAESGPETVSRLAKRVHLSASTVVGILDRLEKHGLVERHRDQGDRRVVNVSATASGRKLVAAAPSALQENLADGLAQLPEQEQATIARSLAKVVELMEAGHIDAAPILATDQSPHNSPADQSSHK